MPDEDELLIPDEQPAGGGGGEEISDETFEEPAETVAEGETAEVPAVEGEETVAEEAPPEEEMPSPMEGAVAALPAKATSDAFTVMLILSTVFFIVAIVLAMMEINEFYAQMVWF